MNDPQNNNYFVPQGMPAPDADAIEHSQKLSALIKQEINQKKRIPFSRFMELALYAQGLGYYSAGSTKLGESGDFITAPEISSLFSRCIAKQCGQVLSELDSKYILEFGAGSGKWRLIYYWNWSGITACRNCTTYWKPAPNSDNNNKTHYKHVQPI